MTREYLPSIFFAVKARVAYARALFAEQTFTFVKLLDQWWQSFARERLKATGELSCFGRDFPRHPQIASTGLGRAYFRHSQFSDLIPHSGFILRKTASGGQARHLRFDARRLCISLGDCLHFGTAPLGRAPLSAARHQSCFFEWGGMSLETECAKMIPSIDNHPGGVQRWAMYRSSNSSDKSAATLSKAEMKRARQMEGRVANLKRRVATMSDLIADFDRMAANLDREVRIEEDRVNIHDSDIPLIRPTPRRPL